MSITTYTMKTHSRVDITENYPDLNECVLHGVKPSILKIVAGKRKETFYTANCCKDDECGKIAHDPDNVVAFWNKWNPKKQKEAENGESRESGK